MLRCVLLLAIFSLLMALVAANVTQLERTYTDCKDDECDDVEFFCPVNTYCEIRCHGFKACQRVTFSAEDGGHLQVYCEDAMSCVGVTYNCARSGSCFSTCSGFNSCHKLDVDCGSDTSTQTCKFDCTGKSSCSKDSQLCENYCLCTGDCREEVISGEDQGLLVKTNFINDLSYRGFNIHNVLLHPDFLQFYFPNPEEFSVDIDNDTSVLDFMDGVGDALVIGYPPNPVLSWTHPNVLRYDMDPHFIEQIVELNFRRELEKERDLPFSILRTEYEDDFLIFFNLTSQFIIDSWEFPFVHEQYEAAIGDYFGVFFNVNTDILNVESTIEGSIVTFTLTLPRTGACSFPQPFYGVVCGTSASGAAIWESSKVDERLFFPDLFTGDTATVATGNVTVDFGITITFGDVEVTEVLSIANSTLSLEDSQLTSHDVILSGSLLETRQSSINIAGDLSIDSDSRVDFDVNNSNTIQVGGCVEFEGELRIIANGESSDVSVLEYGCHSGTFSRVVVETEGVEDDGCLHSTVSYTSSLLIVDIFRDCNYVASSSYAVAPSYMMSLVSTVLLGAMVVMV